MHHAVQRGWAVGLSLSIMGLVSCGPKTGGPVVHTGDAAVVETTEAQPAERAPRYLDPDHAPVGPGWESLFDGNDLSGWHGRDPNAPMSWRVEDHILRNTSGGDAHEGVDLVTDRKFWNFEAYCEYRVPRGSNSGFYLRGRYEIQIMDSLNKPVSKSINGAIYDVAAPRRNVSREPDQWQSIFARMVGNKITVVMNGETIIDGVEVKAPTGGEYDQKVEEPGPIMLQGNHGSVDFRNIFIKPLP